MFDVINYLRSIGELKGGKALDLGCGSGRLISDLNENGYDTIGVDKEPSEVGPYIVSDIKDFEIEKGSYDLITARFVLPFLGSVEEMQSTVDRMYQGLKPGGVMFYNYLGKDDPWNTEENKHITFTNRSLSKFSAKELYFSESKYLGPRMNGELKYWHVFSYLLKNEN